MNLSSTESKHPVLSDSLEADILIFNAPIDTRNADYLIHKVREIPQRQKNVCLILTTAGGEADAAFRIMRFLQRKYDNITLFIFGYCKSAGTLMALGADEIVMSDFGEFGPLDVQVYKSDDLFVRASGLDIQQALDVIGSQAYTMFEDYLLRLIESSQGVISTKTAADIASSMAVQLLTPISGQIDPLRLGEMNRVMQVAQDYGKRLDKKRLTQERIQAIGRLSSDYHAHGFVIDYEEAKSLFQNVREPTENESILEKMLLKYVRTPLDKPFIDWLNPALADEPDESDEVENDDAEDHNDKDCNDREDIAERVSQGAIPRDNGKSEENEGVFEPLASGTSEGETQ